MQVVESSWYTQLAFSTICPSNYTLLLIEDDPDQSRFIKRFLTNGGYHVLTTSSALEGIELMRSRCVNLVVTDYRMDDVDGIEFVQQVRALPPMKRRVWLPIIMLTSCDQSLEREALEAGADMYCQKKMMKEHLLRQIEFLLT